MTTLSAFDPLAAPVLDHASVRREVLDNRLTVLLHRDESAPVVAICTYVKAGYFDEPDDVIGIAHVLEHMFFKGTERRGVGDIAKETKARGGYLNAHTIYDHTSYYTVLPAHSFAAGLEIQADAYANSVIDAGELSKELEVIVQEAKRKTDNPEALALETLYELLHDRHRMRRWRIGHEPQLRRLTRDDLLRFYRNFYRPRNTILSIVGDIDLDAAMPLIERTWGAIADRAVERSPGPPEPSRRDFRYREWSGDITEAQLLLGWRTPGTLHAATPLLDLLATVLGTGRASRLYRAVRERKHASSVGAFNYSPSELGVFAVHAECEPQTAAAAARGIWDQLQAVREAGIGAHELERARRIFESRWMRRVETMEGTASYLAEWEALGDWRLGDHYLEQLLSATPDQVRAAAREFLHPDGAAVVLYRPQGSAAVAADARAMRELLERPGAEPLPATAPRPASSIRSAGERVTLEREEARVRVYRSSTGVPILIRHKPGAAIVHLGQFALGGASREPAAEAGLTTLLARTALKGTAHRTATQIAEDAELLGGSIGVSVGADSFGWTLSVPVKHAPPALDLLADVVQYPTIPPDALEIERAVAISDVRQLRDDMYRFPVRMAIEAAFEGHPYGVPALGTETSLAGIETARIREWHRQAVMRAPAVVVVVGDVDAAETAAIAAHAFCRLEVGEADGLPAVEWPSGVKERVEWREKAQTALAIAFPGPARRDEERYAVQLIAGIASGLGGRFFDELRDRQSLAYTVQAFATERLHAGAFLSYIATSPEQEAVARAGLLTEFAKLRDAPVSEDELTRAKTYAIGTHAIRQQSGSAVLADVIDAWLLGGSLAELEEFEERIASVTAAELRAAAQQYFVEERRVEGIVRGVGREA